MSAMQSAIEERLAEAATAGKGKIVLKSSEFRKGRSEGWFELEPPDESPVAEEMEESTEALASTSAGDGRPATVLRRPVGHCQRPRRYRPWRPATSPIPSLPAAAANSSS